MANYSTLKAAVAAVVKTNGEQAITGANMQTVLLSIINSIGGGYIFEGVATPSTDAGTPDQNVFYIGGAGTYANFGTSVVVPPTNIAVFKYNGTWNCEQLAVENGGVFDISAFKAVGGTLATYADLAAALGTGGANVPDSIRKGGMSVKFVQSSDNKYVQYRLMLSTFTAAQFINGANWQGVDVKPIGGSHNLAESGGVFTDAEERGIPKALAQSIYDAKNTGLSINGNLYYNSFPNPAGGIVIPMDAGRRVKLEFTSATHVHQLKSVNLCPNEYDPVDACDGTTYTNGVLQVFETAPDIKYLHINMKEGVTVKELISSFTVDGYDLTKGLFYAIDAINSNKYFIDGNSKEVGNRVIELYLTGLDSTKHYKISRIGYYGVNHNQYMQIVEDGDTETEVANVNITGNVGKIIKIRERNSSGISGYAILNLRSTDVVYSSGTDLQRNLVSGEINQEVVSSLDESPSIKYFLGIGDLSIANVKDVSGSDYINMFDDIEWNDGFRYVYFNSDGTYHDTLKNCRLRTDGTSCKYASPFFMKKGDILEYNGISDDKNYGLSTGSTAAVSVTDANKDAFNSVLNLRNTESLYYYRFVADRDMWVSCNIHKDRCSAEYVKWYRSKAVADVVDNIHERSLLFPSNEVVDLLEQCNKKEQRYDGGTDIPQLILAHFSDIHNDGIRFDRVLQFRKKFNRYIDDIILTGDLCGTYFGFDLNIKELEGYEDVLIAIGNHDVYDVNNKAGGHPSDLQYWANAEQKYKLWMQGKTPVRDNDPASPTYQDIIGFDGDNDNIANWGVTQPDGVGVDNYYPCYYYKDYADEKVRMIVLDEMDFDQAGSRIQSARELAWFQQALDDTLDANNAAYGYHVLIAGHFAPRRLANLSDPDSGPDSVYMNTGFNCIADREFWDIGINITSYVSKIDTFIANGGNFICWLCGHFHWDQVATTTRHPKQLYIAIASGSISEWMEHRARVLNQESEDLFNIVAIDTYNKHIRVARVGSKFDRYLQHAGTMCISYDTTGDKVPTLLSTW